jgi:hypothetical protein
VGTGRPTKFEEESEERELVKREGNERKSGETRNHLLSLPPPVHTSLLPLPALLRVLSIHSSSTMGNSPSSPDESSSPPSPPPPPPTSPSELPPSPSPKPSPPIIKTKPNEKIVSETEHETVVVTTVATRPKLRVRKPVDQQQEEHAKQVVTIIPAAGEHRGKLAVRNGFEVMRKVDDMLNNGKPPAVEFVFVSPWVRAIPCIPPVHYDGSDDADGGNIDVRYRSTAVRHIGECLVRALDGHIILMASMCLAHRSVLATLIGVSFNRACRRQCGSAVYNAIR